MQPTEAPRHMSATPINRIATGFATVTKIDLNGFEAERLKAMGVFEGQTVELSKGGNPVILKAAGSRLAVADDIACRILVDTNEQ